MSCIGHTSTTGWHCGACHLNFASLTGFDRHRPGPARGRCLDPSELTAKGWSHDGRRWHTPISGTDRARLALLRSAVTGGMGIQEPEGPRPLTPDP